MPYYLELPLSNGDSLLATVTSQVDDLVPAGRTSDVIGSLPESLAEGLKRIQGFVSDAYESMQSLANIPDVVTVEFGLMLTAKAGIVVAESSAEAHIRIGAEWHRRPEVGAAGSTNGQDPSVG